MNKKSMLKRSFVVIVILLLSVTKGLQAQTILQQMTAELRSLFQNVNNPHPNVDFFYDLSGHFVDSVFFDDYVPDTSNVDNWYSIYQEMYYMAYDTTLVLTADSVYNEVFPVFQSDTIPIGLIDWDYNGLVDDALTTGTYFIFDTLNTLLYDLPGAPNPFIIKTTFAGSTLRKNYPYTNPVFMVNPQWFFKDSHKNYDYGDLKIDFGDGTGWHPFDDNGLQYYQAHYPAGGVQIVQYGIFDGNTLLQYCLSSFMITSDNEMTLPTSTLHLPGLNISFYEPDPGCNLNAEKKYVIYLEGIDVLNNRHAPEIYEDMIEVPAISDLKNFGYTFVVVDWEKGNAPLEQNAMHVVDLVEYLKCTSASPGVPVQPFVMVGESMGGLIARYALCYMESNFTTTCYGDTRHNTRLLITIDSPHKGANIPLGLQYLYRYASFGALSLVGFSPFVIGELRNYFTALDGAASSEMLSYHVATDPFITVPISIAPIFEHPSKTLFDAQLAALGNYPKNVKLVALSNGSWLGAHQPRVWDLAPRQPGDKMLEINSEIYIKVLRVRIMGAGFKLEINTNPNNTGQVFMTGIGLSRWKIKLRRWGVRLVWWTDYLLQINKSVTGIKPLCVMPGSYTVPNMGVGLTNKYDDFNLLDHFGFKFTTGSGNLNVQGNLGSSFFGSTNMNFNAYSDGTSFGFIPTASSFGYPKPAGQALDFPLLSAPVAALSGSPFDVLYTNPTSENWHHLTEINPELATYQTCDELGLAPITSYLLNREIGDDILFLENANYKLTTPIEVERDIYINYRNVFYNYTTQYGASGFSLLNFPTNYSSSNGAIVLSKKKRVTFTYNGVLKGTGTLYVNPAELPIGSYSWQVGTMSICCIDYKMLQQSINPTQTITSDITKGSMVLYPNPTRDQLTIKYQMSTNDKVWVHVYDMMGRPVANWQPPFEDHTNVCYYYVSPDNMASWASGIYQVEISNGKESYRAGLIISK